jgi:hypothetical protein
VKTSVKYEKKSTDPSNKVNNVSADINEDKESSIDLEKQTVENDSLNGLVPDLTRPPSSAKEVYANEIKQNSRLSLTRLNQHICNVHPKKFDRFKEKHIDYSMSGSLPSLAACC